MRLACTTLYLHKGGSRAEEYEDAFYPRRGHVVYRRRSADSHLSKRFAVADGATESLLAGAWAGVLVRAFCVRVAPGRKEPHVTYARAIRQWSRYVDQYRDEREARAQPIRWYEEPGLEKGAFATFLGLQLDHDSDGLRWTAWALGDSCLLHVRDGHLVDAFPRQPGDTFDTSPPLAFSKGDVAVLAEYTECRSGTFRWNDAFLLLTDAVAAWSLGAVARGSLDWQQLLDIEGYGADAEAEFGQWVEGLRSTGEMKNDDVTVMRVSIEG